MCITRYLLVHGLCEVCLYELHLESGRNYCCITAVSVESDTRENIVCLLLWLLCQPGEKTSRGAVPVSSVQFSCSVVSSSLQPHGLQQARLPCPSPNPSPYPNSCPSSQWGHPTISSSVVPFSSWLQCFPASGSFPMSQFFASGDQSIGASASVLPLNIQD